MSVHCNGRKNNISMPIDLIHSNPEYVFLCYSQLCGTVILILCHNIYTFSIKYVKFKIVLLKIILKVDFILGEVSIRKSLL